QNNIAFPPNNINETLQNEKQQIHTNYIQLQKQYISANDLESNYLLTIADTSQKIKSNPSYSQSLNQLKEIKKNIETQIASNQNNPTKESQNTIINNQLQLLQQLRQLVSITQATGIVGNEYLKQNNAISSPQATKDTALSVVQKIPVNLSTTSLQQIQSLIQEQKQIEDNLKTNNPVVKSKEEVLKNNELINAEITQLTNKAIDLKQKITQTTDQKKKAELQLEFDRTTALVQEKKLLQMANEIIINQSEYNSQQTLLNELINSIPSNKSDEKNSVINTMNEIQKLKKQEESLIKDALNISNPSAQLGAMQNVKIKQQEYIQTQQQLITQLQKYKSDAKKQDIPININDPLPLSIKYQSNLLKQIKEWEALNNNLNMEITRLYPKYSNTPAGKLLTEAQKLITESKNTTDINKKLELQIKAVQLQQQAMQLLSATPLANTEPPNNQQNQNKPVNQQNQQVAQNENKPVNQQNQQVAQNENKPVNQQNQQVAQNQNKPVNQQNQQVAQNQNKPDNTTEIINNFIPQIKSLKISKTSAYSDAKPIPLNPQLPEGLIFSVQVGAFKNPLPNNFFNGISPVFSQTTENNLYRYLVGQMQDVQEAIALKNNFRNLGYTDAFVIAYYNGKRISLSEALELMKKEKQQEVKINPFATTNVLEKANIPTYTTLMETTQKTEMAQSTVNIKDAEEINDLYYTIQVGVYGKNVSDATFKYIKPIVRDKIDDKFYRYSAGIYDNISQVQKDLNKVIALGMKDAFICAYWNGKRIFYPQAEKLTRENKNIRYATPQPIIFPDEAAAANLGVVNNPSANNAIVEQSSSAPAFDPTLVFTNNVTKRPEPTPENGVKSDNAGICFRVQIGAFKNRVPKETADKYFKIQNWPIEVHYINGLYIYTVGNFVAPKYAAKLREQMIALGINDAFITVYKDNQKLFGYEALKYLSQQ
ncbi:MAG: SPOR domain-containing protein, partial [Bacteroidia bacterium]|nr:SPOR domain-containing protein [Bacteroidia bacterium]